MKKGAWADIPPKSNRSDPICFGPYLYRARNQGRAVLQQDQTMSSGGDALRQAGRQLPCLRPARVNQAVAASLCVLAIFLQTSIVTIARKTGVVLALAPA